MLAKVLLLGVLVVLGAANRERLIPALRRAVTAERGPGEAWAFLRRNVRTELGADRGRARRRRRARRDGARERHGHAAVAVPPAAPGRVSDRVVLGDATLRYTVDPASVGLNTLNLYLLDARGRPYDRATGVRAELVHRDEGIGPILIALERVGRGHYVNSALRADGRRRLVADGDRAGAGRRSANGPDHDPDWLKTPPERGFLPTGATGLEPATLGFGDRCSTN